MTKYYICVGDRTTGGGVVVEGSVSITILGRPVSTIGMKAICCGNAQTILKGWENHSMFGRSVAYDGCSLSCGHKVVASQNLMGWDNGDSSPPESIISNPQKYHEFFTLTGDDDKPVANQKYKLFASDGSELIGYTDEQGKTEHLWTHEKLPINLEILDDEEEPEFDTYHITDV
ncbi:MAG: PAAR domain-containing protein [Acinetobacter sp.]|jgi:uncharacterized Zn-binding protein involved in type VI secretion|nr:PAAR domain-containing protein [Acinetobacter sp.]